jgi:putative membrane protein
MLELIVVWIVTTISLLIISRIELFGIDIRSFPTALIVALVLGLLNALLTPILNLVAFIPMILTFGLFSVVINAFVFWLASRLVNGFELRRGCLSALLGPIVLSLLNTIILWLLGVGQS